MKIPHYILLVSMMLITGCTTMSRSDKERYQELKNCGIRGGDQEIKSPVAAGALNLLPGFGNFYLAAGTDESDQWLFGFLNLLTWPVSPIWGIPEAVIDANTINKKETIYYYTFNPYGQQALRKMQGNQSVQGTQYIR